MLVTPIPHPGLGNTSYLIDLGDGSALILDPERNPRPYLETANRRGLVVRHVAETHLHADLVSGARELVASGARLLAPGGADLAHRHRSVTDGEEIAVGDLSLKVVESPGQTPEHVSYVLEEGSTPVGVFTGGTLMLGGVARPDLISDEVTRQLARQAYRSVRRLLDLLPGEVILHPTHGAGSFCSSADASSSDGATVASERLTHPAMVATDEKVFVEGLLSGLGTHPPYFRRMREVYGNDLPGLTHVTPNDLEGRTVVDVRPIDRFTAGHIPDSISIELRSQFGTWLGWLLDPGSPLVYVLDEEQDLRNAVRQALNVGHGSLAGHIRFDDWRATGGEIESLNLISAAEIEPDSAEIEPDSAEIEPDSAIIDVRQDSEWHAGHAPTAVHIELGALSTNPDHAPVDSVIHCGHGQRAVTAASLLERAGRRPRAVTTARPREISDALAAR